MAKKAVTDHLGNRFNTIKEMCEYWGIPYITFNKRMRKFKWTLDRALTTPVKPIYELVYNGVQYKSIRQLAMAIGINEEYIGYHLHRGKTIDDIIALKNKTIVEYGGNTYNNLKELAKDYGINYPTFINRIHSKKSLDEALQHRTLMFDITSTNILGTVYGSVKNLSTAWGIDESTIRNRLKKGFDIEITAISNNDMSLIHIGLDGKAYYKVQWAQDLVTARQIVGYYRPDLIEAYDKNNPTGKWNPVLKENQNNQEENKDGRSDI